GAVVLTDQDQPVVADRHAVLGQVEHVADRVLEADPAALAVASKVEQPPAPVDRSRARDRDERSPGPGVALLIDGAAARSQPAAGVRAQRRDHTARRQQLQRTLDRPRAHALLYRESPPRS